MKGSPNYPLATSTSLGTGAVEGRYGTSEPRSETQNETGKSSTYSIPLGTAGLITGGMEGAIMGSIAGSLLD